MAIDHVSKPMNYTKQDMLAYENLVEQTQVIFNPLTKGKRDKPKCTTKYKDILSEFEKAYETDVEDTEEEEKEKEKAEKEESEEKKQKKE